MLSRHPLYDGVIIDSFHLSLHGNSYFTDKVNSLLCFLSDFVFLLYRADMEKIQAKLKTLKLKNKNLHKVECALHISGSGWHK